MLTYCLLEPWEQRMKFESKYKSFSFMKMHLKISSAKWWPFCPEGDELKQRYWIYMKVMGLNPIFKCWFPMYIGTVLHCDCVDVLTFNSLAPERFEQNFRQVIFNLISVTDGWGISCKIALRWMPLDLPDDKSTLVQVMAWCRQATSHYLSQCWPRFMSPYGVTRPQWVNNGRP